MVDWESLTHNAEAELSAMKDRFALCDERLSDMQRQYDVINQRQLYLLAENIRLKKILDERGISHG